MWAFNMRDVSLRNGAPSHDEGNASIQVEQTFKRIANSCQQGSQATEALLLAAGICARVAKIP